MSPRQSLALLALLILLGAGAFLLRGDDGAPPVHQVGPTARAHPEAEQRDAPAPAPALPDARQPAGPPAVAASAEDLRVLVRGRVLGEGRGLAQVNLSLTPESGGPASALQARSDREGRFEFDVSAQPGLRAGVLADLGFQLFAMAPDRLPEERSFRIARSEDTRAPPDSTTFVLGPGLNVFELDVEFAATALVRGAIVGVDEVAARTFSIGAARPDDSERQGHWFQRAVPHADGSFEMRLPAGARYAIVAAARSMRPVTGWIDLPSPGEYSLALTPEPGLSIKGRMAIAAGLASEGIAIELQLEPPVGAEAPFHWPQPHQVSYETLAWVDGRFEWSRRSTRLLAGGRFRLVGLAERPHELRVLAVGLPDVEPGAFRVARLQPPALALELGPLLAALTLELGPASDGPLAFTLVETRDGSAPPLGPFVTNPRGAARLYLPPHSSYDVHVNGNLVGRVVSAAAGEHGDWSLTP